MVNITEDKIKKFLEGYDDEKYIVGIEPSYNSNTVYVIINDPEKGMSIKTEKFYPFIWMKDISKENFYGGDKNLMRNKMQQFDILTKKLQTGDDERLNNGFKFLVKTIQPYNNLVNFFKNGGLDPYERKDLFMTLSTAEQFLIQTGKRLFKGYDEYSQVHKLVFDLETTGLDAESERIFAIGVKDNRGFEQTLVVRDNSEKEELRIICELFEIITNTKPAIIAGFNSENFDFHFIIRRLELMGIDPRLVIKTLSPKIPFKRKEDTLKLANEIERYTRTVMWGYNVIDVIHGVRRAQAINSNIKQSSLKYIAKFAKVAKPNRIYIDGSQIPVMFNSPDDYTINWETGEYKKFNGENTIGPIVKGKEIVNRYLLDDIDETELVDNVMNQSSFTMGKIVPTIFSRVTTMGTAVLWKTLMLAWSYENDLAIPAHSQKRDFIGGLSRLLKVGYSKNIVKLDFKGLYPSIQISHDVFPDCDITGAMKAMLKYLYKERNYFNGLKSKCEKEGNDAMARLYDIKQLPIKILNNSMYGSLTAPDVFPWSDLDKGELITCTARQYLRLMIKFFISKGFDPIILDTDGVNFKMPDDVNDIVYTGTGENWLVLKDVVYTGVDAVVAEFNDLHMKGVMGLSKEIILNSTINLSRKNYANLTQDNKIKLTGNTIKSKGLQLYIEEFIDIAFKKLLNGDGKGFIEEYYDYIDKIYNKKIPLFKIANKKKVKITVKDYIERSTKTNKNGGKLPKLCHIELAIKNNITPNLGDTIYYVNNGTRASHGDTNYSYMIDGAALSETPDMKGDYNVPRYISIFNKRIEPLLVVFCQEVRDTLLVTNPEMRNYYTSAQTELISGIPFEEDDQDSLEELLEITNQELEFWKKIDTSPEYMYVKETV